MEDLKLIKDLGTALDPDGPAPHERMRARVMTGVTSAAGPQLGWRQGPGRRPIVWAVPLVAAAAVVGIGVTVAGPLGNQPSGAGITAPRVDPGAPDAGRSEINLDARTILLAAAEQAGKERSTVPAAGSFIYSRFTGVGWESDQKGKNGTLSWVHDAWYSVDGKKSGMGWHTQDGFVPDTYTEEFGTCPGKVIQNVQKQGFGDPYCDGPGYISDLPTDAAGALKYLRQPRAWQSWSPFLDGQPSSAAQRGTDDDVFNNSWMLLRGHQLPPASQAAIFKALAMLPGMQVVPKAKAADGRIGVAVGRVSEPADDGSAVRTELIFGRKDRTIIGLRTILNDPARGIKDRVHTSMAVAEKVVVSTVGLRPDGSRVKPIDD